MARFYPVAGPVFGVECLGEAPTSTPELPAERVIFCGGGGSSKTGVGNAIVAADLDERGLVELCRLDTGEELCSGVKVCRDRRVLVAVFGKALRLCALSSLSPAGCGGGGGEPCIEVASVDCVADFKEGDAGINCVSLLDAESGELVATGGEDGVPRIWGIDTAGESREGALACRLATTCSAGHCGPVTDCSFSPSGHLLATCGPGGTLALKASLLKLDSAREAECASPRNSSMRALRTVQRLNQAAGMRSRDDTEEMY